MAFWHNSELPRCKGRIDSIALTLYAPALCIYVNAYSPPSEASAHTHARTHTRAQFPSRGRLAPRRPAAFLSERRGEVRRGATRRAHLLSSFATGPMASSCTNYTVRRRRYIIRVHVAIRTSSPVLRLSLLSSPLLAARLLSTQCAWNLRTHIRKARV